MDWWNEEKQSEADSAILEDNENQKINGVDRVNRSRTVEVVKQWDEAWAGVAKSRIGTS